MSIMKYGMASVYGYGVFYKENEFSYVCMFRPDISIFAKSKTATETRKKIIWDCKTITGIRNNDSSIMPLYLVMDDSDGLWREYYSGMPINVMMRIATTKLEYDIDGKNGLPCYISSSGRISAVLEREMNVSQFATCVSGYSEQQIRFFVERLAQMQKDAERWCITFENTIKEVAIERSQKESKAVSIESSIAAGFGRYAINGTSNNTLSDSGKSHSQFIDQGTSYNYSAAPKTPAVSPRAREIISVINNRCFHQHSGLGYDVKAVDSFVQSIYDQCNGTSAIRITTEVISTKEFPFVKNGYNTQEVDEFLDRLCDLL